MFLYFLILRIAALFSPKARKLVAGQAQTIPLLRERRGQGERWVWFHAASSGEFEQARPVIERLKARDSSLKVLLTFFSPSGYEQKKDYQGADLVAYLPFATRRNARRFVRLLQPEMAVFVKYEYWPAYLRTLKKNGIPAYIICALYRPDQPFFRWWGGAYRRLLGCFTHLFVQDRQSASLLREYGIENATVAGDTRFDRVYEIFSQNRPDAKLERFVSYSQKVIIAGSTWLPDEKLLVHYLSENPDVRLVIAPHEFDLQHRSDLFQLLEGRYVLYSEATDSNMQLLPCMVVDEHGLLSRLYRYATVAYVGGGFGAGIHNTIEAAVYSVPVLFGPKHKHFREAQCLIETGGGFPVRSYADLQHTLDRLLADPRQAGQAAGEYVRSELGAIEKIDKKLRN